MTKTSAHRALFVVMLCIVVAHVCWLFVGRGWKAPIAHHTTAEIFTFVEVDGESWSFRGANVGDEATERTYILIGFYNASGTWVTSRYLEVNPLVPAGQFWGSAPLPALPHYVRLGGLQEGDMVDVFVVSPITTAHVLAFTTNEREAESWPR